MRGGYRSEVSPPYACLGMGRFEKTAFNSNFDLLDRILLWKRFIDDILMLFKGKLAEFTLSRCHKIQA